MNKIALESNFRDFYDYQFDRLTFNLPIANYTLHRNSDSQGMTRMQLLDILKKNEIRTPPFGQVYKLANQFPYENFVVYTDPYGHVGEGKIRVSRKEALEKYNCLHASVYIPGVNSFSIRELWIGNQRFGMMYWGSDDWRSNVGDDVKISSIELNETPIKRLSFEQGGPLYAIDYVLDHYSEKWAVDLNHAPGLRGTPIEEQYKPQEIYNWIQEYFEELGA